MPRADVARVVAVALARLPVVDVAIEDVPVEEIVADLFASGSAASVATAGGRP